MNRLRVIRQVRYSPHNENCLDLVLFLNGVPVATAESKSDFTQSVADAVDQYIKEHQYRIGTLVAFSDGVNDPDSGAEQKIEIYRVDGDFFEEA